MLYFTFFWTKFTKQPISPSHTHIQRLAYSMLLVVYCISRDFSDARGRNEGTEWRQPPLCLCEAWSCVSACTCVVFLLLFVHVLLPLSHWLGSFLVSGNVCIGVSCDVQIHDSEVCSCLRTHCLTLCLRIACVWEVMHAARRFRCQSGSSPHLFISMTEELSCQSS